MSFQAKLEFKCLQVLNRYSRTSSIVTQAMLFINPSQVQTVRRSSEILIVHCCSPISTFECFLVSLDILNSPDISVSSDILDGLNILNILDILTSLDIQDSFDILDSPDILDGLDFLNSLNIMQSLKIVCSSKISFVHYCLNSPFHVCF